MPIRPSRLALAGILLATGLNSGCSNGRDAEANAPATGPYGRVHTGLCAAIEASTDGSRADVDRAFGDIHTGLHQLAEAAEGEDRAVAARLLEAKQRTETEPTTRSLLDLSSAAAEAIEVTGGTAPDGCP